MAVRHWLSWLGSILTLFASAAIAAPASVQDYTRQPRREPTARIAYGPASAQVVELFLPKGRGPHPVVLLIHGGCYLAQFEGLAQTSGIAADLAGRGYAVWNVEYRKLGEPGAGYPGTFLDVADAVGRIRTDAVRYNLDVQRVVALGHSAGGHLALWAAGRHRLPKSSPLWRSDPQVIRAVISLGGIGDLEGQGDVFAGACGKEPIPQIIGAATRTAPYADTSPAELLPLGAGIVMMSGVSDHVMPPFTGQAFAERAQRAGDNAVSVAIADAGHFDVVIPTTAAWKAVVKTLAREMARLR